MLRRRPPPSPERGQSRPPRSSRTSTEPTPVCSPASSRRWTKSTTSVLTGYKPGRDPADVAFTRFPSAQSRRPTSRKGFKGLDAETRETMRQGALAYLKEVTGVEVNEALDRLLGRCHIPWPALKDDVCVIYGHRPVIARKWGIPLWNPKRPDELQARELNFKPGEVIEAEGGLQRLTTQRRHFCHCKESRHVGPINQDSRQSRRTTKGPGWAPLARFFAPLRMTDRQVRMTTLQVPLVQRIGSCPTLLEVAAAQPPQPSQPLTAWAGNVVAAQPPALGPRHL